MWVYNNNQMITALQSIIMIVIRNCYNKYNPKLIDLRLKKDKNKNYKIL